MVVLTANSLVFTASGRQFAPYRSQAFLAPILTHGAILLVLVMHLKLRLLI
jgi:hypothetical protein